MLLHLWTRGPKAIREIVSRKFYFHGMVYLSQLGQRKSINRLILCYLFLAMKILL